MNYIYNKSIILCGFMACGKSTVGKELALRLELPYIDTDELIVSKSGMSIPDIFVHKGEAVFREYEKNTVHYISCLPPHVISSGAGMLCTKENAVLLRNNAIIIYIYRDFPTIFNIISNDKNRPMAYGKDYNEIKKLYDFRAQKYMAHSNFMVENLNTVKTCTESIVLKLFNFYGNTD